MSFNDHFYFRFQWSFFLLSFLLSFIIIIIYLSSFYCWYWLIFDVVLLLIMTNFFLRYGDFAVCHSTCSRPHAVRIFKRFLMEIGLCEHSSNTHAFSCLNIMWLITPVMYVHHQSQSQSHRTRRRQTTGCCPHCSLDPDSKAWVKFSLSSFCLSIIRFCDVFFFFGMCVYVCMHDVQSTLRFCAAFMKQQCRTRAL